MRRFFIFLVPASVGLALACSSTSPTQACTDLATAVCSKVSDCAPFVLTQGYGNVATCTSRTISTCESALALKDTADTPDFAEKCSKAYATLSCDNAFENNPATDCKRTESGKLATGAVCGTAGQCATNVCQVDPQTGCGTCIAAATSGGACKSATDCVAGLVCASAVCVAPVGVGQTCSKVDPIIPCGYDLICDTTNKCQTPLAGGSACDTKNPLCDGAKGFWCTPHGTRCTPILTAATGQPCGYNTTTGDLTACSAAGLCTNIDKTTLMGTCLAPAADGAACDTGSGPLCQPPAVCTGNTVDGGGIVGTCTIHDPSTCH